MKEGGKGDGREGFNESRVSEHAHIIDGIEADCFD